MFILQCAGMVLKGRINTDDTLLLGPTLPSGSFVAVKVKSIHYNRVAVKSVEAGQTCSLALKKIKRALVC